MPVKVAWLGLLGSHPVMLPCAWAWPAGPWFGFVGAPVKVTGTLETCVQLPVGGGFDLAGQLTRDPAAIAAANRMLPIGFWKGSGLALMLDLLAALLSGGNATHQITPDPLKETGLSQVFIACEPSLLDHGNEETQVVDQIIEYLHGAQAAGSEKVRYPGERTLEIRNQNLAQGIPVEPEVWQVIRALTDGMAEVK